MKELVIFHFISSDPNQDSLSRPTKIIWPDWLEKACRIVRIPCDLSEKQNALYNQIVNYLIDLTGEIKSSDSNSWTHFMASGGFSNFLIPLVVVEINSLGKEKNFNYGLLQSLLGHSINLCQKELDIFKVFIVNSVTNIEVTASLVEWLRHNSTANFHLMDRMEFSKKLEIELTAFRRPAIYNEPLRTLR